MTQLHAQPYDISAQGFYFDTAEEYRQKAAKNRNDFGGIVEEYEIQFIDGDSIRPEPGGIRLLFIDGKAIRRTLGGKVFLHVSHPDIRPTASGERLMFIDGAETNGNAIGFYALIKE